MELPTPTELHKAVPGISAPYASQLLKGRRPWSLPLALRAYRSGGWKLGPLAKATDEDIAALERLVPAETEAA